MGSLCSTNPARKPEAVNFLSMQDERDFRPAQALGAELFSNGHKFSKGRQHSSE